MGRKQLDEEAGKMVARHTGEMLTAIVDEQIELCQELGVPHVEALAGVESALVVTLARFLAETFALSHLEEILTVTCLKVRDSTLQLAHAKALAESGEPPERTH